MIFFYNNSRIAWYHWFQLMTQILGLQLLRGGIAWFYVSVIDLVRVKTFGQMLLETIWNNLSKNKKKNQVKIISIKIIYIPDGIERTGRKGILCTVKYLCIYATQLRKEYLQKNPLITSIIYFNFHYFTISHGLTIFLLISYCQVSL